MAKLPHLNPALPSNFADQFFLKEGRRGTTETEETTQALRPQIEEARAFLAELESRLSAAEEAEADAIKAEAARVEAKAQLAELDRAETELAARRAALEAQLATPI